MTPPQSSWTVQPNPLKRDWLTSGSLWIPGIIAFLAVCVRAWMAWTTHSTTEDFYITLRYAENIVHGAGFVYNHGERVLGTTTPLYTLFLALSAWLNLDPVVVGKLVNIAADGVTCFLIAYLPSRPEIGNPRVGKFAALLYAVSSTPISITIGGMETGLVTCVGMGMIAAYVARSERTLYVLGAVLFLLRIDGLVLFGLLAGCLALQQRRMPWSEIVVAVLIVTPWIVFASAYFGSPVPTSLTAKLYVYAHGMSASKSVTMEAFRTQFAGGFTQKALSLLFVIGVIGIAFKSAWKMQTPPHLTSPTEGEGPLSPSLTSPLASPTGGKEPLGPPPNLSLLREGAAEAGAQEKTLPSADLRAALAAPIAWLLIYYVTMISSRVPPFPWYFLPPWPVYLIIAMLGARLLLGWIPAGTLSGLRSFEKQGATVALVALGLYGTMHLRQIRKQIMQDQYVEDTLRTPIGLWFHEHALPNERILLEPIGYIGYFSDRPILDMVGLVSPEVFRSYRTAYPLADMVARFRPEWLCLRPGEKASIQRGDKSLLDNAYVYVREFHLPASRAGFVIYHRKAAAVE